MLNTTLNYISYIFNSSTPFVNKGTFLLKNTFVSFIFSIGIISSIQWISFNFLSIYCHNSGLKGLILNPINLGNPLCLAVNNIQIALVNHYISLWAGGTIIFISWIISTTSRSPLDQTSDRSLDPALAPSSTCTCTRTRTRTRT